jgi:hypothetical protein
MHDHLDNASLDHPGRRIESFPRYEEPVMNPTLLERSVAPGGNRGDQASSVGSANEGGEGERDHDLLVQRDWVFEQSGDGQSGQAASPADTAGADTEAVSAYLDEREMEIPPRI